ncbi:uncharacterized protein LOC127738483 [Mytilus californianus]|uniref:uncharacterized protein LOC127738483 n=1 Tax=Mytilus californianus TaxID=6549 RepID=UPI0022478D0E|nr:uncharacterized protein LOC127738483 [Mytilus californianus]
MADNKYLGKTAPDLGWSNVYDSAGDGKTFHLNEIPKWRLGNSYSAGFDYISSAGENIADSKHGIGESRKPTESYDNRGFVKSTKSLSATRDTKTAVSSSTRLDQSADYTDDESSSSSNNGNRQDEQMLTWRKMLLDPLTAGQFLSRQWPRISLRASYTRKEPYVAPDEEDADLDLEKEENDTKRRRKCTIYAIISGILLIVIAIIPVIVITNLQKEQDSSKLYVRVNMTVEVDRTFTQTLTNSRSQDYKSFTDEFCYEIGNVYNNNSLQGYHGCKVSGLKSGSISVNYIIYFTGTPLTDVESEAEMILNDYLNVSSSQLGPLVIKPPIVVYSVSVEILTAPPTVQGVTAPNSVSSLELSLIETSGIISTLESTFLQSQIMPSSKTDYLLTMETTMQFTESLQSEQQTTKNSFSSPSETSNFAAISTTVPIAQTESVTLIKSYMQTLILSSEPSMSIDKDQVLTTTSEYLELESNSFELSTSNSYGYTPTDALSNGISLIFDTSVDITTTVEMTMTSSGLSGQTDNMQTFSPTDQTTTFERTVTTTDATLSTADLTNETTASTILLTDESTLPITKTEITQTTDGNIFETNTTPETNSSTDNTTTPSMTINTTEKETPISQTYQTSGQTTTYSIISTPKNVSTLDIISSTEEMSSESTETTSLTYTTSPNTLISEDLITFGSRPTETTTEITTSSTIETTSEITTSSTIKTTSDITESTGNENTTMTSMSTEGKTTTAITTTSTTTEGSTADKTTSMPTVFSTEKLTKEVSYSSTVTEKPTMETTDLSSTEQTSSSTESQSFVFSCTNITANLYSGPEIMTCTIGNAYQYNQIGIKLGDISSSLFIMRIFINGSTDDDVLGHPDITVYFDNSTSLTFTFRNITDEVLGTYDIILVNSSGVEIAKTQGFLSASAHVSGIFCDNELKATLCSSSEVVMRCKFKAPEQTDNMLIGIYHGDGLNDTVFGILLYLNGTVHTANASNEDIDVAILNETDIVITLKEVSALMGGYYHVSFIEINSITGELDQLRTDKTYLSVTRPPDNPTLTLDPDQVIGLEFVDGNFYRAGFTHICEGNVGHPPKHWVIDIMYSTKTEFTNIPDGNIKIVSSINKSIECGTIQRLEFALLFNEEMDAGKLRCRISESGESAYLGATVSDQLMLIPRNYCSCAEVKLHLEHPKKCDVYVECVEDGPKKYAFGKACENAHCTNSETGACSHNCSSNCTKDTLDYLDFCPTSLPPLKQSTNVYCNGSSILENTGPANIVCELNVTTYDVITVTFRASIDISVLAYINSEGNEFDLNDTDGISISFETNILTISLQNVTCYLVGLYGVEVNVSSNVTEQAEGELTMIKKPNGNAVLKLHPDQFADLETGYRSWLLHSCRADVGSPAGSMEIEILKQGDHQFRNLNVTVHAQEDETVSCSIERKTDFGISFTSDMDKAVIRCRIKHELFPDDPVIYSNNETVSLLQINFCENNTANRTFFQHPYNCNSFIQCEKNITYSKSCQQQNLCFGTESTNACGNCDEVTCKNAADIITTKSPIEQSQYLSCNESYAIVDTGPVDIVCEVNSTFDLIKVERKNNSEQIPIAKIYSNRTIEQDTDSNRDISMTDNVITIKIMVASCGYGGTYIITVYIGEVQEPAEGILQILTKPDKPSMTEPLNTIEDALFQLTCTGNVGSPAGSIEFLVRKDGEVNFTLSTNEIVTTEIAQSDCRNNLQFQMSQNLTSDWNKTTIKCRALNDKTVTEDDDINLYTSDEHTIILIEENYCASNETYKLHPRGCNYFIECDKSRIFTKPCIKNCFNFNVTKPECVDCSTVPPPCYEPLS